MGIKQIRELPAATSYSPSADVFAIQQSGTTRHISGSQLPYATTTELNAAVANVVEKEVGSYEGYDAVVANVTGDELITAIQVEGDKLTAYVIPSLDNAGVAADVTGSLNIDNNGGVVAVRSLDPSGGAVTLLAKRSIPTNSDTAIVLMQSPSDESAFINVVADTVAFNTQGGIDQPSYIRLAAIDPATQLEGKLTGSGELSTNAVIYFDVNDNRPHIRDETFAFVSEIASISGSIVTLSAELSAAAVAEANAYTDAASAALQAEIDAIVQQGTSVTSSGGTILVTQDGLVYNVDVIDGITASEVATLSGSLVAQIAAVSAASSDYLSKSLGGTMSGALVAHGISSPKGTGSGNEVYGANAGANIGTGQLNTVVGGSAGFSLATGSANTAVGNQALILKDVSNSTALGYQAGANAQSSNSVFLGWQAGHQENRDQILVVANAFTSSAPASANALVYGEFDTGKVYVAGAQVVTTANISAFAPPADITRAEVAALTGATLADAYAYTDAASAALQAEIDAIIQEGTSVTSSGGTILVTNSGLVYNVDVIDGITKTEVASISAGLAAVDSGLQSQVNAITATNILNLTTPALGLNNIVYKKEDGKIYSDAGQTLAFLAGGRNFVANEVFDFRETSISGSGWTFSSATYADTEGLTGGFIYTPTADTSYMAKDVDAFNPHKYNAASITYKTPVAYTARNAVQVYYYDGSYAIQNTVYLPPTYGTWVTEVIPAVLESSTLGTSVTKIRFDFMNNSGYSAFNIAQIAIGYLGEAAAADLSQYTPLTTTAALSASLKNNGQVTYTIQTGTFTLTGGSAGDICYVV